jgi:predicted DNA-binding transcriptional regulator AlpA
MSRTRRGKAGVNRLLSSRAATQPRRGLGRDEAAIFVGVSLSIFDSMVNDGRLPKPVDLDGDLVWDLVQLDRAMDRLMGLRRSTL